MLLFNEIYQNFASLINYSTISHILSLFLFAVWKYSEYKKDNSERSDLYRLMTLFVSNILLWSSFPITVIISFQVFKLSLGLPYILIWLSIMSMTIKVPVRPIPALQMKNTNHTENWSVLKLVYKSCKFAASKFSSKYYNLKRMKHLVNQHKKSYMLRTDVTVFNLLLIFFYKQNN